MKKKHSVQTALQSIFFLMMTAFFIIYMSSYVFLESRKIAALATETLDRQVSSVLAYLDGEFGTLDTVMQNTAYSNLVKEYYLANREGQDSTGNGNYGSMQNAKILSSLLTAIIGPDRPVDQIYLYGLDEGSFGVGLDNSHPEISVREMSWYPELMESSRNKIMLFHRDGRLSKYFTYEEGSCFLTLCSVFQNNYYKPIGIIEVKRSFTGLLRYLKGIDHDTYRECVYLYDPKGSCVYASGEEEKAPAFYEMIRDAGMTDAAEVFHLDRNAEHLFALSSSYSGFTVLSAVSDTHLYAPLGKYLLINFGVFLFSILLAFLLCRTTSRVVSNPINRMYAQLSNFCRSGSEAVTDRVIDPVETNLLELDSLYTALIDMNNRVKDSVLREMNLRDQEMQSRMLALQSQMNPHFLYNSLATIQSLADEHMDSEVIRMCQMTARILRYISSDRDPEVPLKEDVSRAEDYLSCMKMRYEDDLEYSFDIPEEMGGIRIPKLCLQLIIENAIKYSVRSVRPPWKIRVEGRLLEDGWEVSVLDNGNGFAGETLDELNRRIEYIDRTGLLPSLEINGMGLLNIYIRLRSFYGERRVFRITNSPEGGAVVTIGGSLEGRKDCLSAVGEEAGEK